MELAEQKRVLPLGERKIEGMGGKIGENKGSSKPNELRALEKRPKALSCKCSHVSLAVHYVCSSEQCDGARKTATPAWISLGNCERPSAARRPATTTAKSQELKQKSRQVHRYADTLVRIQIQIQIQKGVRTRN